MRPLDRVTVQGRRATVTRVSPHGVTVRFDDLYEPCPTCQQKARVEETYHPDALVAECEQLGLGGVA